MMDKLIKQYQGYHWSIKCLLVVGAFIAPPAIFGLIAMDLLFPDEEE